MHIAHPLYYNYCTCTSTVLDYYTSTVLYFFTTTENSTPYTSLEMCTFSVECQHLCSKYRQKFPKFIPTTSNFCHSAFFNYHLNNRICTLLPKICYLLCWLSIKWSNLTCTLYAHTLTHTHTHTQTHRHTNTHKLTDT